MHCPGLICPLGCPRTHRASVEEPGYRAAGSCSLSGLRLRGWAHKVPTILDHLRFPRAVPPAVPQRLAQLSTRIFTGTGVLCPSGAPFWRLESTCISRQANSGHNPGRTRTAGGQDTCPRSCVHSPKGRGSGAELRVPKPGLRSVRASPACDDGGARSHVFLCPAKLPASQAAGQPSRASFMGSGRRWGARSPGVGRGAEEDPRERTCRV